MEMTKHILAYLQDHHQESVELLMELAQIPAPSHQEQKRARFIKNWLERQGAKGVYVDEALNVIYPVGVKGENDLAVFAAHSDVVFPDTDPLPLRVENGRIYCPGVGDDTACVVALLMTAKYIAQHQLQPKDHGVLLVINAAEEGLGNLKGTRRLIGKFGSRIREFVSFDDHDCFGVNRAVGSRRFRISVDTEGGHSFSAFGNRNAIACLASMIEDLYRIRVPEKGKTTYNVGTISGGTSVNTIAQHAEMLYEFRSDERDSLNVMQGELDQVIRRHRDQGLQVTVESVGDRPCGAEVDGKKMDEMMARADDASKRYFGKGITFESGSTDCNIPLSVGIPAICVGVYSGAGSHTREEWVAMDSLLPGQKLAAELILHFFS